ncbi:MAG: DUF1830 domain-containing protein [Microcoleus sp. SIO2G3]|nr:DUF1830 domain-containing protein [Microcoleus sp. SIO2G3]
MTQILDALPTQHPNRILCSYHNPSFDLQIARISNISHWYFERVVFPGDLLLFEAVAGATLEIYSGDDITTLLSDRIPCESLQITTPNYSIS